MVSVNNSLITKITLVLFACCVHFKVSAQKDSINIALNDYHSANITAAVASKERPYYFTADASGKVLAYHSKSKKVVKTIRSGYGIPVKSLRLVNNENVLVINQKYNYSDGKTDSVIGISIYDQKILMNNQASVAFIGNQDDAVLMRDTNKDGSLNIIEVYDKNFQKMARFYASRKVTKGAYNLASGEVALVQREILDQHSIVLMQKEDYKKEDQIAIPKTHEVLALFYDRGELFAITANKESNYIELFNFSSEASFASPVYTLKKPYGKFVTIAISRINDGLQIGISSDSSIVIQPALLQKNGDEIKDISPELSHGASQMLYLQSEQEYIFFDGYNPNFTSEVRFSVYDNLKQKVKAVYPEVAQKYYAGHFLPENNWMILGQELTKGTLGIATNEYQIKYYETGTFSNRFGKLDYNNYLESKHKVIDYSSSDYGFNKNTGLHAFLGYRKQGSNEREYGFFVYDLINDEVELITNTNFNKNIIVDYNPSGNLLLLSEKLYYNNGYTKPQEFAIIKDGTEYKFEGLYKFGKFSNNGEYILLISDANTLSIHEVETRKQLYSEDLKDGSYKIFSDSDKGFFVSVAYGEIDLNKCNTHSTGYYINNTNDIETQQIDCANIIDIASSQNISALILENIGLAIGDKLLQFQFSEFPVNVSLNEDASKAMLSFSNGKIKIYDTNTLSIIGEMLHPDKNSHVFTDVNNNYFSNVNPDRYILSSENNISKPLKDFDDTFFNPEAILKVFGEPNATYVAALKKAMSLKRNQQFISEDVVVEDLAFDRTETGDLYVLAVGVSNYEQTDYNLTFADKDAFDIAKIYGNLSPEDLNQYKTKFYGKTFVRRTSQSDEIFELNKYFEMFKSLLQLYPLTRDGQYWLEVDNGVFMLWNFAEQTIQEIELPSDFQIDSYAFNPIIYASPDNEGFYYRSTNDELYHFNFSNHQSRKINISEFKTHRNFSWNHLRPVQNNLIAYYSTSYEIEALGETIKIQISDVEGNPQQQFSFKTALARLGLEKNSAIDTVNVFAPNFKAISNNGKHFLYSDIDNNMYYKDLTQKDELPLKLKLMSIKTLDQFSISNDGNSIVVISKDSAAFSYTIKNYDKLGNLTETRRSGDNVKGIIANDGNTFWIAEEQSLINEPYLDNEDLFANFKPKSFSNTHVKYLVNEAATASAIKSEILNAFKQVKPNDQIILFLAGHGVLDEDLNYYFAPHDMHFEEVKKKGISFKTIVESLNEANTQNILLLMDSCHSGSTLDMDSKTLTTVDKSNDPNKRGSISRRKSKTSQFKVSDVISDLFEDFLSQSGITIISASSGEDVAYEHKDLGNGAFTSAYIELLERRLGSNGIGLTEAHMQNSILLQKDDISELMKQVILLTEGRQTPDLREQNSKAILKLW